MSNCGVCVCEEHKFRTAHELFLNLPQDEGSPAATDRWPTQPHPPTHQFAQVVQSLPLDRRVPRAVLFLHAPFTTERPAPVRPCPAPTAHAHLDSTVVLSYFLILRDSALPLFRARTRIVPISHRRT